MCLVKQCVRFAESRSGLFVICLIFAFVKIHSLVVPLDAMPFENGRPAGDPAHVIWTLWHVNEAITSGRNPYFTDQVFYPVGGNLSHHTLYPGFFPVTLTVKMLSGASVLYPVYAYRIIILLSFTLLLYFSYLLLREIGSSRLASAASAIAYSFCAFYMNHGAQAHLNHLAGFFIPLVALRLVRLYREPTTKNIVAFALVAAIAIYFTEFALYIYMAALCFALVACLSGESRRLLIKVRQVGLKKILFAAATFSVVVAPFLAHYFSVSVIKPERWEHSFFSADLADLFIPYLERTPLYKAFFAMFGVRENFAGSSFEAGVAFPLLLFACVALLKTRGRLVLISATTAVIFYILSLGPTLKAFGTQTNIPMPYFALMHVPPFDMGRTPVRFVAVGAFFLMIVAAAGMTWTERALTERWSKRWGEAAMLAVLVWALAETSAPAVMQRRFAPPPEIERIVAGPVLNLPLRAQDGYAAMLQAFHHQPIATGYLSRNTIEQLGAYRNIEHLVRTGGTEFCARIESAGYRNIIIAPDAPPMPQLDLENCRVNVIDLRQAGENPR